MTEHTGWRDLLAHGRAPRLALIWLGIWLNAADSLVTATIMPSIGRDLGGYAWFSWTIAGFLVGAIVAGSSAGRLSERMGLPRATMFAGLIFAAGCGMSAAALTIEIFVAGRLVQGLGSGWVSGFAMVAIAELFPERHLGRVFASASSVWGIATILGPLIGGLFGSGSDWRWVFWLFAGQALIFATATPFLLRGATPALAGARVPLRQLGILTAGVALIAIADLVPRSAALAILLTGGGLVCLLFVLRIDRHARVRLLPRAAGDLTTSTGAGYFLLFAATAAGMPLTVYGPAILQRLAGLSPLAAGYTVAAEALLWTLAALTVAGVDPPRDRVRIRWGTIAIVAGLFLQLVTMRSAIVWQVVGAAAVMGAGFGLISALSNRRFLAGLAPDDKAVGSAGIMAVRQTGGAVGAAVAGTAANLAGFSAGLTDASAHATAIWAFAAVVPFAPAALWAAWRLTRPVTPSSPAGGTGLSRTA